MNEAMRAAKTQSRREAVEAGFRLLIRLEKQAGIRRIRGKVK
jgi:Arc/MetJ family transcription regulator